MFSIRPIDVRIIIQMNKSDWAYILIDKYHSGQATQEELVLLKEWKSASPQNKQIFNETVQILNLIGRFKDWNQYDELTAWQNINHVQRKNSNNLLVIKRAIAVAAIFLLILTGILWINFGSIANPNSFVFNGESTKYSILADGSELFFTQNAEVDYDGFDLKNRYVKAKGDFFINVAHDAGSPFIIQLRDAKIKVLGTSFFIDEDVKENRIAVRDGKVAVETIVGEKMIVEAGRELSIVDGKMELNPLSLESWGLFSKTYNDTGLFTVLHDLADQFGNLSFSASNIDSNCKITTKINEYTILEILEELSLIFNIDYTIKDGTIVVNKVSC